MAIAQAVRSVVPDDHDIMTAGLNVNFVGGGKGGVVTASGRTTFVGKRLIHGEAEIKLGDQVLARGTGIWYARPKRATR